MADLPPRIQLGSSAFWRTTLGMVAGGWATFAALYCVQRGGSGKLNRLDKWNFCLKAA